MSLITRKEQQQNFSQWLNKGEQWVWVNAMALSICIIMVFGLVGLIFAKGFAHFWPASVYAIETSQDRQMYLGEMVDHQTTVIVSQGISEEISRTLLKTGNRELYSLDFKWLNDQQISNIGQPEWVAVIERHEWGNAYGDITALYSSAGITNRQADNFHEALEQLLSQATDVAETIHDIERYQIGSVNKRLEKLRIELKKLDFLEVHDKHPDQPFIQQNRQAIYAQQDAIQQEYLSLTRQLDRHRQELIDLGGIKFVSIDGFELDIPFSKIVRIYFPNQMGFFDKVAHYVSKLREFIFEPPREANTEGGVFPAIFGTVVLVILMTIFVTPLGVITAIYLKEYAHQGPIVRAIRISVNNLAGVPSIVYGVFGLGFFVYVIGGSIDELFYSYSLPSPTFGSPNMLWASLTLALLTLPVVIVSTEEGLNRIPRSIREGSLALGATKLETIWRTVLPMTSPAIMTGVILAIARAAGEVAPLMLVGVVKLAPDLVVDSISPYIHLDRQFMHLGFHIYDVGFQSPNVEAARPLVYATATLLVLIIIILNLTAIRVRNRLRERYKSLES